jgi:hypothetical protein
LHNEGDGKSKMKGERKEWKVFIFSKRFYLIFELKKKEIKLKES